MPPAVIAGIFLEARRILRPSGRMIHLIDHSDHWSHQDPGITAVNFLQYPDWLFRLTYLNPLNYQNRLRHSEYVALLQSAGFSVLREERTIERESLEAVSRLRLAPAFRHFRPDDLAATSSVLLAAPGAATASRKPEGSP